MSKEVGEHNIFQSHFAMWEIIALLQFDYFKTVILKLKMKTEIMYDHSNGSLA